MECPWGGPGQLRKSQGTLMRLLTLTLIAAALSAGSLPGQTPTTILPLPLLRRPAPARESAEKLPAPIARPSSTRPLTQPYGTLVSSPYSVIRYDDSAPRTPNPALLPVPPAQDRPTPTAPYRPSSRQPRQRPQYLPPAASASESSSLRERY
jgi:hypothetical protein